MQIVVPTDPLPEVGYEPTGWPDLDSPAARMQFFGGEAAKTLAARLPILPACAPGLPPLGPGVAAASVLYGDPPLPAGKRERAKWSPGPYLHAVVRAALYHPGLCLPLDDPEDGSTVSQPLECGLLDGPPGTPYGPARAPLVVFGKCLGREEVNKKRPFEGPGSAPLWRAWREAGLPPRGSGLAYLTNLVRFCPPEWAVKQLPRAWVMDGKYLFFQELLLTRPDWVWVLGADAAKAVFGPKAKVTDLRGAVAKLTMDLRRTPEEDPVTHTCNVVVTDHPAKVAREPEAYPVFLTGARMLAAKSGLGSRGGVSVPAAPPPDYRGVYTADEFNAAVDEAVAGSAGGGYVAVDCEWHGRHPGDPGAFLYTVQFSYKPHWARAVFVNRLGGVANPDLPPEVLRAGLDRLLARAAARGARVVGHNLKADLLWLHAAGCDLYPQYVAPADDPDPDGSGPGRLFGWQKTYTEGFFDTYVAAHAVAEQAEKKLEVLAALRLGVERYDTPVLEWKERFCKERGIKQSALPGYGFMPEDMVVHYGCSDSCTTGRLYLAFNGDPRTGTRGDLDRDRFGLVCRDGYHARISAAGAWAEMEFEGLLVDLDRHRRIRERLIRAKETTAAAIRAHANWPDLNLNSTDQKREFLFGEEYAKNGVPQGPAAAVRLSLPPYKATDTTGGEKLWDEAVRWCERKGMPPPQPSTDAETLIALLPHHPLVREVYKLNMLTTQLKLFFRPAVGEVERLKKGWAGEAPGPLSEEEYDKGLLHHLSADGRVRSMFWLVETGRGSSSKPNLQNCLRPGAEYLTDSGWVPVEEYDGSSKVAQFDPATEKIEFVPPLRIIKQEYKGDLVHLATDEQIELTMTPDHRCLTRRRHHGKNWLVTPVADLQPDRLYYHAGNYVDGTETLTEPQLTFLAAVVADGSWCNRSKSNALKFSFQKQRKYLRLTKALRGMGCTWTEPKSRLAHSVYVGSSCPKTKEVLKWAKQLLGQSKTWGPWLLDLKPECLRFLADELFLWDGLFTRRSEVFSSNKNSADWMQIVYTLTGVRARMRPYWNKNPNSKICHIVGVPTRRVPYSMTTNMTKEVIPYSGFVYCVSVPSSFIVVRQNGKVSITGNCGSGVDERLNEILGFKGDDEVVSRSVFKARPGHLMVSTDLVGAEVAVAGWMSGDALLIEHAHRNTLPSNHPDYLDLHSDLAVKAFKLDCPPNKKEIERRGYGKYRKAAKPARFGLYYGASAETIWRKALESDPNLTLADIQRLIAAHDDMYPTLKSLFTACQKRVRNPGWMCGPFGGRRRFFKADDEQVVSGMEREAQNFICQGPVADTVSVGLGNFLRVRRAWGMKFRIVLSVHDSVVLEVPYREVAKVVDHVIPLCMTEMLPFVPTDLDGRPVPGRGPYRFAVDTAVGFNLGEKLKTSEWREVVAAGA